MENSRVRFLFTSTPRRVNKIKIQYNKNVSFLQTKANRKQTLHPGPDLESAFYLLQHAFNMFTINCSNVAIEKGCKKENWN